MIGGQTVLAFLFSLGAACDSSRATAPPAAAPAPSPSPAEAAPSAPAAKETGGCAYEEHTGQCRLVSHETASANDGKYENVVVRGQYQWTGQPEGVTGAVEWPMTRDRAPAAEAHLAAHPEVPCAAVLLVSGACPPQSSRVSRIDIAPP